MTTLRLKQLLERLEFLRRNEFICIPDANSFDMFVWEDLYSLSKVIEKEIRKRESELQNVKQA